MMQDGKIGVRGALCLLIITITSRVFFTSPGLLAKSVGTAGWYMTLISALCAAIGFTLIYLLLKRYPGKNIVEIFEVVFGKYISIFFSVLLALVLIANAAIMLREFSEVMKVYVLPITPIVFTMGVLLICVTIVSSMGLESITTFSSLVAIILLVGLAVVLGLSFDNYKLHRLAPIQGYGLGKTILTGLPRSSVYGDVIILAIVSKSMQGLNYIKKVGYLGIAISGILISLSLMAFSLTLPYYAAEEITAPMYHVVTLIDYGRFFQRLESIFLFVWNISTFISVTANFYAGASTYCKTFKIRDIKPVIIPLAILTFSLAMIPKDISEVAVGYVQSMREYGWAIFFVPPAIALLISLFRRKGGKESNA